MNSTRTPVPARRVRKPDPTNNRGSDKDAWRYEWAERKGWLAKGMLPGPCHRDRFIYRWPHAKGNSPMVRKDKWDLVSIGSGEVVDKTYVTKHWAGPTHKWLTGIGPDAPAFGLMYGMPSLLVAVETSATVYWTEGEKDARSAVRAHYGTATSVYQGKAPATEAQAEHFRGFRGIVALVMDRDPVGVQIAWQHAALLRAIDVRYEFKAPRVRRKKADLTDHIKSGLGPGDLITVSERRMAELIVEHGALGESGSSNVGSDAYIATPEEIEFFAEINARDISDWPTREQESIGESLAMELQLIDKGYTPQQAREIVADFRRVESR